MTTHNIQSRSTHLLGLGQAEDEELGRYLEILKPAPEPRLGPGRERVLAEAARLSRPPDDLKGLISKMAPRLALTWALAIFLLVGGLSAATWAANSAGPGNLFFGLSSTPTVAFTAGAPDQAAATVSLVPTPSDSLAPVRTNEAITPAPVPTPVPTLPLQRTAQSRPTD